MNKYFVNLLPAIDEKFTNFDDFHNFLIEHINCDEDHVYKYFDSKDDVVADCSVTSILKDSDYCSRKMKIAAIVGHDVHKILYDCANKRDVVGSSLVREQEDFLFYVKRSDSYAAELPVCVGLKLEGDHNNRVLSICGTIDFIGFKKEIGKEDEFNLIEHKTSNEVYLSDWMMQTIMYAEMYLFLCDIYLSEDVYNHEVFKCYNYYNKINGGDNKRGILCSLNNAFRDQGKEYTIGKSDDWDWSTSRWLDAFNHYIAKCYAKHADFVTKEVSPEEREKIKDLLQYLSVKNEKIRTLKYEISTIEKDNKHVENYLRNFFNLSKIQVNTAEGTEFTITATHKPCMRVSVDTEAAKKAGLIRTTFGEDDIVIEYMLKKDGIVGCYKVKV